MSAFGKIGNILCIILAWILSIALVVMLLVAPLVMSTLSLLNSETIAEVVVDLFMELVEQEEEGGVAANYQLTLMSNTTQTIPQDVLDQLPQDVQDSLQKGEIDKLPQDVLDQLPQDVIDQLPEDVIDQSTQTAPQNKPQGNNSVVADILESYLGAPVTQETVQKVMSSNVVKEVIQVYAGDLTNVITGKETLSALDAEKIKSIVDNNIDEVATLVQEIQSKSADASGTPNTSPVDVEALKQEISKVVEEKAEEIIQVLPKPEQIKEEIIEQSPELEIVLNILGMKDTIELAIVAVIAALCVLIFLCRLWGFRGFRWLAVDLFVAGGINLILAIALMVEIPVILNLLPDGIPVKVINNVLSALDKAMLTRAVAMIVVGGVLLAVYILIKKLRNKKRDCGGKKHMEKYDIIILAGQSNAQGQGRGPVTKEFVPDERIHFMKDDSNPKFSHEGGVTKLVMKWPAVNTVEVAKERLNKSGEVVGCFALQFAEKYVEKYLEKGRKVLIVDANFGGTGFARPEWGVGNPMHTRMLAMTKAALDYNPKDNRVVAILWAQGEHDSFENADWDPERRYTTHKKNLIDTFNDYYEKLGDRSIPLVACGFPETFCNEWPEATDAVLKAIREVIVDEFGGGFVETQGLPSNALKLPDCKDIYHYCRESLHILGGKIFDKYSEIRK